MHSPVLCKVSGPYVRFQVLTAASMKFRIVFWDVLPCKIIVLMMEAVRTSETSVDNHFTRQYIPEDKFWTSYSPPWELEIIRMMEAVRTSETSVDNYFTRQYIPEDNSELQKDRLPSVCVYLLLCVEIGVTKRERYRRSGIRYRDNKADDSWLPLFYWQTYL
jgi:hypothetical protein